MPEAEPYAVLFTAADGALRPLSVIAGESQTGKTSVIDFIKYALGGKDFPRHDEVISHVRGVLLDVELRGQRYVIERSATGSPSSFATVWRGRFGDLDEASERRFGIEPTGDPESFSQFILGSMDLDGIKLLDSATKDETNSSTLSVRDLFRFFDVPNERLDNGSLVFEHGEYMVRQKYKQTVDVVFGVYDNEEALLRDRYRAAREKVRIARAQLATLEQSAERDFSEGAIQLGSLLDSARAEISDTRAQLKILDSREVTTSKASQELRDLLSEKQSAAVAARIRLRERESLLDRLNALRAQYASDQRKLGFLADAQALFNPLGLTTCPVCLQPFEYQEDELTAQCGLCHQARTVSMSSSSSEGDAEGSALISSELRAVRSRLTSLDEYLNRLQIHTATLRDDREVANREADAAAKAVDAIVTKPAPWLALRDRLTQDHTAALLVHQQAAIGVKAWSRVAEARATLKSLESDAREISSAKRNVRPDRSLLIADLTGRFTQILKAIGFPKLRDSFVQLDLIPVVKGLPYSAASSGGRVVAGLAYTLALFEIAYERGANAPGLLIIDSPQKNLGHNAQSDSDDFSDASLVGNFYSHVRDWLADAGQGAQVIVVDNSPPELVSQDIVVQFSRRADRPPYGLIRDATR